MKSIGIARRVDGLGRVILPKESCQTTRTPVDAPLPDMSTQEDKFRKGILSFWIRSGRGAPSMTEGRISACRNRVGSAQTNSFPTTCFNLDIL